MRPALPPPRAPRLVALIGPTGAGKSTIIEAARTAHPALRLVVKEQTRPLRPSDDAGRRQVTPAAHAAANASGRYFFVYRVAYGAPSTGKTLVDDYGLRRDSLPLPGSRGDTLMSLTDPASVATFEQQAAGRQGELEVLPLIVLCRDPRDLERRLEARACGEEQREARREQATSQWRHFMACAASVPSRNVLWNEDGRLACAVDGLLELLR